MYNCKSITIFDPILRYKSIGAALSKRRENLLGNTASPDKSWVFDDEKFIDKQHVIRVLGTTEKTSHLQRWLCRLQLRLVRSLAQLEHPRDPSTQELHSHTSLAFDEPRLAQARRHRDSRHRGRSRRRSSSHEDTQLVHRRREHSFVSSHTTELYSRGARLVAQRFELAQWPVVE